MEQLFFGISLHHRCCSRGFRLFKNACGRYPGDLAWDNMDGAERDAFVREEALVWGNLVWDEDTTEDNMTQATYAISNLGLTYRCDGWVDLNSVDMHQHFLETADELIIRDSRLSGATLIISTKTGRPV